MTNSKRKPDSLKLLSLNVRGLGNFRKRRATFTWLRKQKADLIFLQETHTTKNCESQWKKEWGSSIMFSHGSTNARGVAVLIRSGLDNRDLTQNTTATATRTTQKKYLMSKTIAVHVRYNSWYISLPSSAKQQREMTKFCVVWRT